MCDLCVYRLERVKTIERRESRICRFEVNLEKEVASIRRGYSSLSVRLVLVCPSFFICFLRVVS